MPSSAQQAEKLLLAHCNRMQRREWRAERAITVSTPIGRLYISGRLGINNVHYVGPGVPRQLAYGWLGSGPRRGGNYHRCAVGSGACLCVAVPGTLPRCDKVLAIKLAIETNPKGVMAIAPRITADGDTWLLRKNRVRVLNGLPQLA